MKINNEKGVIQNCAIPFSSVIGTGLFASLRVSRHRPDFQLGKEPHSFELHSNASRLINRTK